MPRTSLRFERVEFEERVGAILASLQIRTSQNHLYTLAFTHRSVLNEVAAGYTESNERLEFLGDAVLELVITEKLFQDFREKAEGEMTDIRSALVRGRNLAQIAQSMDFSKAIQLSRGESNAGGQENPYILANTLEAFIGALYLEFGFDRAKDFILSHVYVTLPSILEQGLYVDPKSHLQEITQGVWGITPLYQVEKESGQDHNKIYTVGVYIDTMKLAEGNGSSKKKAEGDAAERAIRAKNQWFSHIKLPKKPTLSPK